MAEPDNDLREGIAALLPRLRRFGRTLACHRDDADGLVQAAVERALRHGAPLQPGTRLDRWMFRIMQNAWIDETQARERRGQTFVAEEDGEHVGPSSSDAQIDAIAVRRAVARLGDDHRVVVGLVLVEGLPYMEAAEVLGVPIGILTRRLAGAREALMALLAGTQGAQ
ncbi:MAG TPA: sigma-70 family RNA polymerase sigma factor [Burkholderiaceae bacterium]|nr:sigma-70 family RNA polymerase sigma factor [Burkholderiaceae bacterium]